MSSSPSNHEPLLNKKRSPEMHESLLERTITSIVAVPLAITLYVHRQELLQRFVPEQESRGKITEKVDGIVQVLVVSSLMFLLKGIFRPANREKGSGHKQLNYLLNVLLSIFTLVGVLVITEAAYDQGIIGILAKTTFMFLGVIFVISSCVAGELWDFINFVWRLDLFDVGDVIKVNDKTYEVLDIDLNGTGGLTCREEETGHIVNMPSPSVLGAKIVTERGTYTP